MRRNIIHLVLLATGALLITACNKADRGILGVSGGDPTTVLRRGNGDDPATLDPALAEDVHTFNILVDLYEGLIAEAADGSLVPGVASSWEIGDDRLVYTFHLRTNARWSNGDPVVAGDFVHAFRRVASPDTLSPYNFLLESIDNFRDISDGTKLTDELGLSALDDQTLEIRLSEPNGHFLAVLAMPIAFPTNVSSPTPDQFLDPAHFVGNGAYVLADRQIGGPIRLRANEHYWDRRAVEIDEVVYLPIVDTMSELNMYRAGELDITGTIPQANFRTLHDTSPKELRVAPALALYYLAFDLTEEPLQNRALRQALSMAVDRETLVALLENGEAPAYGLVPPGVANHVGAAYEWRESDSTERQKKAIDLYREAGYDSDNPLKLKLTYDTGSVHELIALAVSSMWQEVLGVNVEFDKKEWKLFLAGRDDRPSWQMMRFSWFGDYNDAMTFAEIFRSDSPQNLPRYDSGKYDGLLDRANSEIDANLRRSLMHQAEATLLADYPIIPLYFYVSKHLVKPHVLGFEDNILDRHPSKYLSIVND